MATSLVQVRVDENVKRGAEAVFGRMGLDLPTAIRAFLKRTEREDDFPFDIRQYNDETRRAMQDVVEGKGLSGPYNSLDELWADLMGGVDDEV